MWEVGAVGGHQLAGSGDGRWEVHTAWLLDQSSEYRGLRSGKRLGQGQQVRVPRAEVTQTALCLPREALPVAGGLSVLVRHGLVPVRRTVQSMQGSMSPQCLGQRLSPALGAWSWAGLSYPVGHEEALSQKVRALSLDLKPFPSVFLFLGPFLFSDWPAMAGPGIRGACLVAQQVSCATCGGHRLGLGDPWCTPCCLQGFRPGDILSGPLASLPGLDPGPEGVAWTGPLESS